MHTGSPIRETNPTDPDVAPEAQPEPAKVLRRPFKQPICTKTFYSGDNPGNDDPLPDLASQEGWYICYIC